MKVIANLFCKLLLPVDPLLILCWREHRDLFASQRRYGVCPEDLPQAFKFQQICAGMGKRIMRREKHCSMLTQQNARHSEVKCSQCLSRLPAFAGSDALKP